MLVKTVVTKESQIQNKNTFRILLSRQYIPTYISIIGYIRYISLVKN